MNNPWIIKIAGDHGPPVSRVEVYEAKEIPRPPTGSVEADAILYAYGGGIHGRDEDDIYRDTLAPDGR